MEILLWSRLVSICRKSLHFQEASGMSFTRVELYSRKDLQKLAYRVMGMSERMSVNSECSAGLQLFYETLNERIGLSRQRKK